MLGTNTGKKLVSKIGITSTLIETVFKCGIIVVHTEKQLVEELLEMSKKITGGAKL